MYYMITFDFKEIDFKIDEIDRIKGDNLFCNKTFKIKSSNEEFDYYYDKLDIVVEDCKNIRNNYVITKNIEKGLKVWSKYFKNGGLIKFQDCLADEYKYKKLSKEKSDKVQKIYKDNIPKWLKMEGDNKKIFTPKGYVIAEKYDRIVVGDYGAFIEMDKEDINSYIICIQDGQEYRIYNPKYSDKVKYHWYTTEDKSNVKIYLQQKTVTYANYKPNKYYISVYECIKNSRSSCGCEYHVGLFCRECSALIYQVD